MATDKLITNDIVTLNFNGWIFEGYEDAKTVLLETVLDSIQGNSTLTTKGKQLLHGLYKNVDKIKMVKKGITHATDLMTTGGVGIMVD